MKETEFTAIFESLTARQRKVIQHFLAEESDEAIAAVLYVEPSTVRRHLANICKEFGFSNIAGEHYSYRDELRNLFLHFRPEMMKPLVVSKQSQPLLDLEFPGSPMAIDSPFYVDRSPIEERCAKEIKKPGALLRIRAPLRMGKTSLLHRVMASGNQLGYRSLRLDLRQAEPTCLQDLDSFLQWFCLNLSLKLGISPQLEAYWDRDRFGSLVSCTTYVQGYLLEQLEQGLLLGLDEVDWLFEFPAIAHGFFALLRSWHEEASNLDIWQRLRLVVVHATEVYIPLNLHQSPFNVGFPIRLPEFTLEQVQQLVQAYGLSWSTAKTTKLTALVGGHPFLLQLALYHLQTGELTLDELLQTAPTQAGIYSSDLRRHWQVLQTYPELMTALQTVIQAGSAALDPLLAYKLESMGLVQLHANQARVSCALYRQYFGERSS